MKKISYPDLKPFVYNLTETRIWMSGVHEHLFQLLALVFCDNCMEEHKYRNFTSGFPVPIPIKGILSYMQMIANL